MIGLLPKSLSGRTVVILVTGLIATHIVTLLVLSEDRVESLTRTEEQHIAQHIASIANIVSDVPSEWRDRIVRSSDGHLFNVRITEDGTNNTLQPIGGSSSTLADLLLRQVRPGTGEPISVDISDANPGNTPLAPDSWRRWLGSRLSRLAYGHDRDQAVLVSVPLSEGQRLNFSTSMPLASAPGWERQLAVTGAFLIIVLALSLWAIRKMSSPLALFAHAATTFARNVYAPSLPETGPSEVREAARAFNNMQKRVLQTIEGRAQMLGAISHDLRTPLTTIRLRAESLGDSDVRHRILAAIEEMDAMLASTLVFAREGTAQEELQATDIGSLLEAICSDFSDIGHDVIFAPCGTIVAACRPLALKRALSNLIDNAVKYGEHAHVSAKVRDGMIDIRITDQGPGVPGEELERIFQPFYRIESSRNRNTGGAGLGLAIAQMALDMHGGSIQLENRGEAGGLCVRVLMPVGAHVANRGAPARYRSHRPCK
ncbi:MAG: HAMP domain-containing protein [Rhizobiaceae bacterium]|nr:HAMP domain-containing protein [Rhizobiaceae bacterium]